MDFMDPMGYGTVDHGYFGFILILKSLRKHQKYLGVKKRYLESKFSTKERNLLGTFLDRKMGSHHAILQEALLRQDCLAIGLAL